MNPYFSKREKENFVRLQLLEGLLNVIINDYTNAKNLDKQFIADTRRARTYAKKALDRRKEFLDPASIVDLDATTDRLALLFVPRNEVKKHYQEVAKLNTIIPLETKDFDDWYEFLIEKACRTCDRCDYQECQARRVLMKYGVYAYNPEAVNQCQYSYVGDQGVGAVGEALLAAMGKTSA